MRKAPALCERGREGTPSHIQTTRPTCQASVLLLGRQSERERGMHNAKALCHMRERENAQTCKRDEASIQYLSSKRKKAKLPRRAESGTEVTHHHLNQSGWLTAPPPTAGLGRASTCLPPSESFNPIADVRSEVERKEKNRGFTFRSTAWPITVDCKALGWGCASFRPELVPERG